MSAFIRIAAAILATTAALLAFTGASASAATRFVTLSGSDGANNCLNQAAPCRHVAYAAGQAGDGDTVQIGPGQFTNENVNVTTAKRVFFTGAGASIDPSAGTTVQSASTQAAFDLQGGGGIASLRVPPTSGGSATEAGVLLSAVAPAGTTRSYTLDSLILQHSLGALSVTPGNGGPVEALITNSRFIGPTFDYSLLNVGGPNVAVTVRDSSFEDSGNDGLAARSHRASLTLDRVTVHDRYGIIATGGTLDINRSVIATMSGYPLSADTNTAISGPLTVNVRNSVLALDSTTGFPESTIELQPHNAGPPATVNLTGSTIVKRGAGNPPAVEVLTEVNTTATMNLRNTIVRNLDSGADISATGLGASTVSAAFSAFKTITGNVTSPVSAGNLIDDPQFSGAASGNYTLAAGSPLIDKGDPAAVTPAELDLSGKPRALDGNGDCNVVPDIGAFETADSCPIKPAPTLSSASLSRSTFAVGGASITAKRKRAARGTTIKTDVSEAATLEFTVERRTTGRRVGGKCQAATKKRRKRPRCTRYVLRGGFSAKAAAGANSTAWSGHLRRGTKRRALPRGRYRLQVRAVNATGQASPQRALNFRIVKR